MPMGQGILGLSAPWSRTGKVTAYQAAAVYQKKGRGLLVGNYLILDKLGQGGMGDGLQGHAIAAWEGQVR